MLENWQSLRHDGLDRHRALLAEGERHRRMRACRQPMRVDTRDLHDTAPAPLPCEAEPTAPAQFTEREWQRLAFLRWCYRTGRLTD